MTKLQHLSPLKNDHAAVYTPIQERAVDFDRRNERC